MEQSRLLSLIPMALMVLYFYAGWNIWNAIITATEIFPGIANIMLFILWVILGIPIVFVLFIIAIIIAFD